MSGIYLLGLVVSVLLTVYLFVALLWPVPYSLWLYKKLERAGQLESQQENHAVPMGG